MKFSSLPNGCEGWEVVSQETHFANAHLAVATEEVKSPRRPEGQAWTVVHRKAAVIIAPLTVEGRLILIRQERIAIRAEIWEVPAGQIDEETGNARAAIEAVALREMREETGYELGRDGELIPLGYFFSSPGFTDEHGYFFLARGVRPAAAGDAHEESETILECRAFEMTEVARKIAANEIRDANTLGLWARLVALGLVTF